MDSNRRAALRLGPVLMLAAASGWHATGATARAGHEPLPAPPSWRDALAASGRSGKPLVVLFSRPQCPYCAALRLDTLYHLARDAERRGVLVYELDITDERPFAAVAAAQPPGAAQRAGAATPAAVAQSMDVRLSPTVVFVGPNGELAERLVGYGSRDFYNAYLDERIEQARAKLARR